MQGKSVSPLIRVVMPQLSVWYQMFNSQMNGVSTAEMKWQTSCTVSTMNSLAPIPSNGGISNVGSVWELTFSPQPLCENPTTPPCSFPHFKTGRSQLGQSSTTLVPG